MSEASEFSECIGEASTPSFKCLWEIVRRFRTGQIDVELGMMVAKQLHAAFSQVRGESPEIPEVGTQDYTVTAYERLAKVLPDPDAEVTTAAIPWQMIISLLLQLLQLLRKD